MPASAEKKSRQSLKSTSTLSPSDTMAEKPTCRCAAHSTRPAATAPDCDTSARSPGLALRAAKLAFILARGARTPMQFGPTMRSPWARAASLT